MSDIMPHTLIPRHRRFRIIKEYIAEETITKLADRCHCEERTIYRDIAYMKTTGEWYEWLERAMLRYGRKSTVSDTTKFTKYADLYAKQFIKEKREDTVQGNINIKWMNSHEPDTDDPL